MNRTAMAGLTVGVVALLVMAVLLLRPNDDTTSSESGAAFGRAESLNPSSDADPAAPSADDGEGSGDSAASGDGATDGSGDSSGATVTDSGSGGDSGEAPVISRPATTLDPNGQGTDPAGPTTEAGGQTDPTAATTTTTVRPTTVTVDPDPVDPGTDDGVGPDDGPEPGDTVPTVPPDTDGTCRLSLALLDGQSGVVDLGGSGTCEAVRATIQAVNPRDDLAAVRWGRDIEICQRHPAAAAIMVEAVTGGGSLDLADGLIRDPDSADPIQAFSITFSDQDSPITGPRPIAFCRTSGAELSIVHQPVG